MIRILIMLIIAFAVGLFLIFAGLLIVPLLVDPNDYKEQIRSRVYEKTQHELIIHGDIDLSLSQFPQVTLSLGQADIKNTPGYTEEFMVLFDSASIGVELLPLFNNRLEIAHLSVTGLELFLERDSSGWGNWQGVKIEDSHQQPTDHMQQPARSGKQNIQQRQGSNSWHNFLFGKLFITDAQVNYIDHKGGEEVALSDLAISTTPFKPGLESAVSIKGAWKSQNPVSSGSINLDYRVLLDPSNWEVQINDLLLTAKGQLPNSRIKEAELALKSYMTYQAKAGDLLLDRVALNFKGWTDGQTFREVGLDFKGSAALAAGFSTLTLPDAALITHVKADTLPPAGIELATRSDININLTDGKIDIAKLQVKGPAGMAISGALQGESLTTDTPGVTGDLTIDRFDMQALMIALGQPLPEASLVHHAAITGKFRADGHGGELTHFKLKIDDSTFEGRAAVASFAKPLIIFDIKVDSVDIDRYSPNASNNQAPSADRDNHQITPAVLSASPASTQQSSPLPLQKLRNLNMAGKLEVARLKTHGIIVTDIMAESSLKDGVLSIKPFTATLYDGELLANVLVDASFDEPRISIENHITAIQAGSLLKDLTGQDRFTGLTNITANLETKGTDNQTINKNLQGTLSLAVTEGEIRGLDVVNKIRGLYATVVKARDGLSINQTSDATTTTKFSKLTASATIKDGMLENRDLKAVSPILYLTGDGKVDLVAKFVDYTLTADIYSALKDINPAQAEKIKGMTLPIYIQGPFEAIDQPIMKKIDLSSLLRSSVKSKLLEKEVQKLGGTEKVMQTLDKIEEKLGGKESTNKLLKGLFGF